MVRKAMGIGVIGALATLLVVSLAMAQPGGGAGAGGGGGRAGAGGGPGGGFGGDPAQFQQRIDENNRQTLGATEEEWKVLGPKFTKVQNLNWQIGGGGMAGMFGMRRGGGPGGGMPGMAAMFGGESALTKARDSLYTALDNTSATPEQLQQALKTFRDARDKAKQELTAAQADLKKALTIKQEITLVAMGLLD